MKHLHMKKDKRLREDFFETPISIVEQVDGTLC